MERLNNIVGKSVPPRPHFSEQRLSQGIGSHGQRPQSSQSPISHRHLPEQAARQGQQHYGSQNQALPATRTRNIHGQGGPAIPDTRDGRLHGGLSSRSSYSHQSPLHGEYLQEAEHTQSFQARPASNYQRTDDYPPSIQADVVDDWEEDEGAIEMRYGDWESDGRSVGIPYRADAGTVTSSRSHVQSGMRELPAVPHTPTRSLVTRDLRLPPSSPPAAHTRTQEVQRMQRMTQPLNPQILSDVGRGIVQRQAPQHYEQRNARQVVPRDQVQLQQYMPMAIAPAISAKGICARCKGAGYLRADVPYGHPNFGKPIPCQCKEIEKKEKRRQQLRDLSNLDAFRQDNSFSTFNLRAPGMREAHQEAFVYAEDPKGWLFFVGPNGCGKTHLALAIARYCLDQGTVVLFAVVPDLLDHLRAAFAPTATEMYDQLFAKMREAEVLVLDDLGAQQSSPWANEKLFQLLNYRYNLDMPTVITANPRSLQGMDERIRSRLSDNRLVVRVDLNRAQDYRPTQPRRD